MTVNLIKPAAFATAMMLTAIPGGALIPVFDHSARAQDAQEVTQSARDLFWPLFVAHGDRKIDRILDEIYGQWEPGFIPMMLETARRRGARSTATDFPTS